MVSINVQKQSLNRFCVKISLSFLVLLFLFSCNIVKKVPETEYLLTKNTIYVNGEETKNNKLYNYLTLKPNQKLLGYPVQLGIYNMSKDSAQYKYAEKLNANSKKKKRLAKIFSKKQINRIAFRKKNFNDWLKNAGKAPAIVKNRSIEKSKKRLEAYFWNNGWFNVYAEHEIVPFDSLKAEINYKITTKKPYIIDSIQVNIASKVADSIYNLNKNKSLLKTNKQYNTDILDKERNRITKLFRNNGLFNFERQFINFEADTINTNNKVNLVLDISNKPITNSDSTSFIPYKVHKISKVQVFFDNNSKIKDQGKTIDSATYNGYQFYSPKKIQFKPKSITNSIYIKPGEIYKDSLRTLTYNSLSNLGVFKYPTIKFKNDPNDPKNESLIASILLNPLKKYALGFDFDVSTSTIQDIGLGFGGSLSIRNVFRRSETFEISAYGSIGASDDISDDVDRFFNISEVGVDAKLSFPRILSPINFMKTASNPKTDINLGVSTQKNIGLDKESVTSSFIYKWKPKTSITKEYSLLNLQFVTNLNSSNYFNVYTSSYDSLNEIAQDILDEDSSLFDSDGDLNIDDGSTDVFIDNALNDVYDDVITDSQLDDVESIEERKLRLTEDYLILSNNYSFIKDTRSNLYDEDFHRFRLKVESAGLLLNALAETSDSVLNDNGSIEVFNVEYSQFVKLETEYVKRWQIDKRNILAFRGFAGVAIPYGNSNSIPFSVSYFCGGSNDIRAWTAYSLGPGSSGGVNDYNEANFKLLFSLEHRFDLIGSLKGAIFTDVANIWNVLDQFEDEEYVSFKNFKDLKELAAGVGFGLRYDFSFFVLRLDTAWKLHNPSHFKEDNWFTELNFSKTVFNVGINYPF